MHCDTDQFDIRHQCTAIDFKIAIKFTEQKQVLNISYFKQSLETLFGIMDIHTELLFQQLQKLIGFMDK